MALSRYMSGVEPANSDMVEILYREKFSLSWRDMQDEPAEAVEWWVAVEAERRRQQEQPGNEPHVGKAPFVPLEPEDM